MKRSPVLLAAVATTLLTTAGAAAQQPSWVAQLGDRPVLVQELRLPAAGNGVRVDSLAIGPLVFSVPSARVNAKAGIDPTLSPPIQLAVGSDILARLILTVDYARGRLLLLDVRVP